MNFIEIINCIDNWYLDCNIQHLILTILFRTIVKKNYPFYRIKEHFDML